MMHTSGMKISVFLEPHKYPKNVSLSVQRIQFLEAREPGARSEQPQ